jgi:hypothetical protein
MKKTWMKKEDFQKANGVGSWRKYIITNFPKIHHSSIRRVVKGLDDCGP